jgi:hypothetical protein
MNVSPCVYCVKNDFFQTQCIGRFFGETGSVKTDFTALKKSKKNSGTYSEFFWGVDVCDAHNILQTLPTLPRGRGPRQIQMMFLDEDEQNWVQAEHLCWAASTRDLRLVLKNQV